MTYSDTRTRFATLLAKCAFVNGKLGGLLSEEAEEFRRLADELGVEIVEWRRFELGRVLDWAGDVGEERR